jgi:hypothetical protein
MLGNKKNEKVWLEVNYNQSGGGDDSGTEQNIDYTHQLNWANQVKLSEDGDVVGGGLLHE